MPPSSGNNCWVGPVKGGAPPRGATMQGLEQGFTNMQPYAAQLQPQQHLRAPQQQEKQEEQQYKDLLSSLLAETGSGNAAEMNMLRMSPPPPQQQPKPQPKQQQPLAPATASSAPLSFQVRLTEMVLMQQNQLQNGNEEMKKMSKTIEDLRNELHQIKTLRQEEQLLIHRMNLQRQQEQQQLAFSVRQYNNLQHGGGYNNSSMGGVGMYGGGGGGSRGVMHNSRNIGGETRGETRARGNQRGGGGGQHQQQQSARSSSSQGSRNAKCLIDIEQIQAGNETRTTVMVCNIPNRYTRSELMDELESKESLIGTYNFLYLPIDFKNNCNLGYAFVNMRTTDDVQALYEMMHGSHWGLSVRSSKICKLKWGRVQGKSALLGHFLGTMHLNDTPCGFKPVTIEIDESSGQTIVQEVV